MKHLKTIVSVLALIMAVSCAKTQSSAGGQVIFAVSSNDAVADVTKSNVSDYTSLPSAADFTIAVTGEEYTWTGKVSDWSAETVLVAGEYSVTASYGDLENEEGFDKPFFTGSQTFTVKRYILKLLKTSEKVSRTASALWMQHPASIYTDRL